MPECLDDSAAQRTDLSIKQTFSFLFYLFNLCYKDIAVDAPKHPPPITIV